MAAPGTYPEMTEFMEAAMKRVGAANIAELGEKVDMTSVREQRYLYKWWRGEHRPLLTNVMPLMRATGMLSGAGEEAAAGTESTAPARGSVEVGLRDLRRQVEAGLQKIDARVARLEKQRAAGATPSQTKRRRAG